MIKIIKAFQLNKKRRDNFYHGVSLFNSFSYFRTSTIRAPTTKMKANRSGGIPTFNALCKALTRELSELEVISFWINSANSTKIPISATDPAILAVAMVDTVDVVIVEIIFSAFLVLYDSTF
jgi:hypothetical protein